MKTCDRYKCIRKNLSGTRRASGAAALAASMATTEAPSVHPSTHTTMPAAAVIETPAVQPTTRLCEGEVRSTPRNAKAPPDEGTGEGELAEQLGPGFRVCIHLKPLTVWMHDARYPTPAGNHFLVVTSLIRQRLLFSESLKQASHRLNFSVLAANSGRSSNCTPRWERILYPSWMSSTLK